MQFVMRLAREFRRADWRRMLSEMSATELGEWGDYFRMQSFSDVWMDAQFASLKALIVRMVSGSSDAAVADFSLLPEENGIPERTDEELMHLGKVFPEVCVMDQIANLVIDLGIDAAEFKNEIPRIKNLLNGAASDAERSSARMQRFMERQTQAARQTTQAASSAATAASVHAQTVEKNAQAHERMAREVEKTRQRMEALSQKMREEQAQAMALAEAQDKAAAAFYRQIDSVKQASAGLQELQRIQQQIRQARNSGGIGQQDYLALISEVTAKTRVLTQAEEEATRQKVAFIRQLKEQATRQNLSSSELLRAKAAQLGVSSAAEVYIRKMEQAGKATHSLGLKSAAARQEIGVLIGELARGNLGALRGSGITLANRAGWIDTLMSPKGMMRWGYWRYCRGRLWSG